MWKIFLEKKYKPLMEVMIKRSKKGQNPHSWMGILTNMEMEQISKISMNTMHFP